MTLGKAPYPADVRAPVSTPSTSAAHAGSASSGDESGRSGRGVLATAPLAGAPHTYARLGQ
eukprot:1059748-Pleurochrysis_carterae.AAC.1